MKKIKNYFEDKALLDNQVSFHLEKRNLTKQKFTEGLIEAHMEKAKHDLRVADLLISNKDYNDWVVISLYYALYHSCLSLLAKKSYVSKNHTATLLFLIKNYSEVSEEEIELIEEVSLTKSDAEFYTSLKSDRHDANYSTNMIFSEDYVTSLRKKTIFFINKVELILEKQGYHDT
jgi:uncharacterized protein (UPF0332 family)